MKKFKIYFSQVIHNPCSIIIEAEDREDAESLFEQGEFNEDDIQDENHWGGEIEREIIRIDDIN